jgi:2-dehydro-3-deoxyphosphogluconate aldolase/(4S)-4-hydroxy-2-oxoglutarate aldolase
MVTGVDIFADSALLAIVRGSSATATVQTVRALIDEGVTLLEVSLTTSSALDVLADVCSDAPLGVRIGAGTVLTPADADAALASGASFLVTPGVCDGARAGIDADVPVLVGALTPSEVIAATQMGASAVKLFPASFGGPDYLKALRAPFPTLPFVPVGGVDDHAAARYLAAGAMAVGVGSPLVGDAADGGDLCALRTRARAYLSRLRLQPAHAENEDRHEQ